MSCIVSVSVDGPGAVVVAVDGPGAVTVSVGGSGAVVMRAVGVSLVSAFMIFVDLGLGSTVRRAVAPRCLWI